MKTAPIFATGIPPDECMLHSMIYPEADWDSMAVIDWYEEFWRDPERLRDFFKEHDDLLQTDFWKEREMTRNKAIRQIKAEADEFFDKLSAIDEEFERSGKSDQLHDLFVVLHKAEHGGAPYQYKAKPWVGRPDPMLRLYALKLDSGQIIVTGGGIKLTKDMGGEAGMPGLQAELDRLQDVKSYVQRHSITCTADFLTVGLD